MEMAIFAKEILSSNQKANMRKIARYTSRCGDTVDITPPIRTFLREVWLQFTGERTVPGQREESGR